MMALPLKGEPRKGSVFEPKYDGIRVMVHKQADVVSIYTRTFHEQRGKFPELEQAFARVPFDFTLDGEVIDVKAVVRVQGQDVPISSFSGIQSIVGSGVSRAARRSRGITFVVFDCLSAQGKDLTGVPDFLRRGAAELIVDLLRTFTPNVMVTPRWTSGDYKELMAQVVAAGGEGLMVKNRLAAYRPGKRPQNTWSKLKDVDTADVVIMGYKPGEGKFKGMVGAIEFGQYKGGRLVARSRCSGMTDAERRDFTDNGEAYVGRVMEVKYFGRVGPERSFRHPNFICIREDKLPGECVWDG